MFKYLCSIVLTLAFLSACGPLPRPYKTDSVDEKIGNPLTSLRDGQGVLVAPVEYAPDGVGPKLTAAVVKQLQKRNVLAVSDVILPKAYWLDASATYGAGAVTYQWVLRDTKAKAVGQGTTTVRAPKRLWTQGSPDVLEPVAADAAQAVARLLKPEIVEADRKARRMQQARVGLSGVSGAPGNGNRALPRSLAAVLKQAGVPFAEEPAAASLLVRGEVSVRRLDAETELIAITWIMTRRDGEELARITQKNPVKAGTLNGRWGDTAYMAASAVVGAIADTLALIHRQNALAKTPPGSE